MNKTIHIIRHTARAATALAQAARRATATLAIILLTAMTAGAEGVTINSAEDWNTFAAAVSNGTTYSGEIVTLGTDITVSTMAGTSQTNSFKGTFYGGGHTLTFNATATADNCAPFGYVDGAVFKCLKVAGIISTGYKFAAGIAAHSYGNSIIQNCQSSVAITTTVSGDGTHAGFVAVLESGSLSMTNCLFDGSITGANTNNCGGLVGWRNATLTFTNCMMAGAMGISQTNGSAIFNRNGSSTLTNCYYDGSKNYGSITVQGTSTTATGEALRTLLGSGWEVSGNKAVPVMSSTNFTLAAISGLQNYYMHTGSNININYTVTAVDGTTLTKGSDFTESISPATVKDMGNYTLTLTGTGSYSGSQTFHFTVGDGIPVTAETTTMSSSTYKVTENVTIGSRITISGDVKLILGEGTTLTASKGIELSNDNKLTIEGNGTLTATGENEKSGIGASKVGTLVINSGTINATGGSKGAGIGGSIHNESGGAITINGGVVTAKGGYGAAGIGGGYNNWNGTYGVAGTITITGGQVHATADDMNGQDTGKGIGAGWSSSNYHPEVGSLTLGWTAQTDFIYAQSYSINSIAFAEGKTFFLDGTSTVATKENIGGEKIVPPSGEVAKNLEYATLNGIDQRYLYTGSAITLGYTLTAGGESLTKGTHFTESLTRDGNAVSEVKEKGSYTLTLTGISPYTGSKSVNFSVISEETFGGCAFTFAVDDEGNYFEVDNKEALTALATYVNSGNNANGLRFKQTADIDMQGVGFTPIGKNDDNVFSGTYDGDGYLILNLSCPDGFQSSGMFGEIANGTVKNVNLKDCNFTGLYAGGIAGDMSGGTIDNCAVIGGTVSCGANDYSGGIVGYFYAGTIKDCFAANTVSAYSANIEQNGPIVGMVRGYTANNYYTVAVSGGNSTGTKISGGFVTAGEGVTIGSGVWRTIGRTAANTYRFGKQGDAITFSAEVPTTGMKKFTATAGTLAGTEAAGTVSLSMPSSDVTVSLADVTIAIADVAAQTYTGTAIEPEVTVKDGETTLNAGTDYTIVYTDNTDAGTATVNITGKGVYLGTISQTFTIIKATPTVTAPTAIADLVYTGSPQALVTAGTTTFGSLLYSLDGTNYSADIPTGTAAGTYIVYYKVEASDNWNAIDAQTIKVTIAPYTFTLTETDGVTALTNQWLGKQVEVSFARTFSANVASTICLPFAISADQASAAGKFYTFAGVDTSGSDWVVTMQETEPSNLASGELAANTPYLFMPSSSSEVIFSGTIGNVADTYTAGTTNSGEWTFIGTYSRIDWTDDPKTVYGFAAQAGTSADASQTAIAAGTFVRVAGGTNSYIMPFRAYLEYTGTNNARAMSRGTVSSGLPARMTVRLIGADGQTTAIGTLDTRTGEATFGNDAWYTLDGRRLTGQPTAKGIYIYKGKKTVIK